MLALTKEIILSVNSDTEKPQSRRGVFTTEDRNTFYLEMSMEKTTFLRLEQDEFENDVDNKADSHQQMLDELDI